MANRPSCGIFFDDSSGASHYPTRNIVRNNFFVGCGDNGIEINNVVHELFIINNYFMTGTESGYNMTDDITINAGMTAGSILIADNYSSLEALGDFVNDNSGGGTIRVFNNNYTADA